MFDKFIDIHTHSAKESSKIISIVSEQSPNIVPSSVGKILYSIGLHPWNIDEWSDDYKESLKLIADRIVAIGEIGIDRLHPEFERQQELFEEQIKLAIELKKPIITHSVKCFNETLLLVRKYKGKVPNFVIHSFIGDISQAKQYIKEGCFLSFSPRSFLSTKTVKALELIPLERLFFESDQSGESIEEIYKTGCDILGISVDKAKKVIYNNFKRVICG